MNLRDKRFLGVLVNIIKVRSGTSRSPAPDQRADFIDQIKRFTPLTCLHVAPPLGHFMGSKIDSQLPSRDVPFAVQPPSNADLLSGNPPKSSGEIVSVVSRLMSLLAI